MSFTYDNNGNMIAKSSEITKKIDPANVPTPTFGIFIYGQTIRTRASRRLWAA
ncbi:hypothetical protein [Cohnella faecalis]|uniref:hypothetical protein n=1 Tax=Cohnella faecalis TaxID=2315694 RepID=UPI001314EA70|nr:hypothetical protein [Cohnella faecalis]